MVCSGPALRGSCQRRPPGCRWKPGRLASRPFMRSRTLPIALLALAVLAVLVATLSPGVADTAPPGCPLCVDNLVADALTNVILFLPVGIAAKLLGWRWRHLLIAGACLSAGIEFLQVYIPGRHGTVVDILCNVAGVAAGGGLVGSAGYWLRPPDERAGRLAFAAGLAAAAMFALTAYLLQPAFPQTQYYGQWTAIFPGLGAYRGTVLEASLDGLRLPTGRLADSDTVRELLMAGATLRVRAVAGPPVEGLAPIVSIADELHRRVLLVGASSDDIILQFRRRASALRLSQPSLRIVGALQPVAPGDTVEIAVRGIPGAYCIEISGHATCPESPTVGVGWTLLAYPGELPTPARTGLRLLWVAGLIAPFGLWARSGRISAAGALVIVGGLLLVPALTQLAPSGPAEYVGAAIGFVAGRIIRRIG